MDPAPKKERKPRAPRQRRLYQRRWCRPCKECGTLIVFLDETRPPINGKARGQWAAIEIFGVRDGEPSFWDGGIAYDPSRHVIHTSCPAVRRRLRWLIERAQDDI